MKKSILVVRDRCLIYAGHIEFRFLAVTAPVPMVFTGESGKCILADALSRHYASLTGNGKAVFSRTVETGRASYTYCEDDGVLSTVVLYWVVL